MKHPIVDEDIDRIIHVLGDEAKAFEGKTILISGGGGFLGSYIIATLHTLNKNVFKKPCRVISIDNYITGSPKNLIHDIRDDHILFVKDDIQKPLTIINGSVDYIIHAAGLASPFHYKKYPLETIEAAIIGARNLLDLARVKKPAGFLFFSSSEIYGDPDPQHIPTPETYKGNVACVGPRACYDESKRLSETICAIYQERFGVPVKIVRPFNVYGPGMRPDDYRVIPAFANNGLRGKPLRVYGSGNQTRTYCYISDAVAGFFKALLLGTPGEAYNIGIDEGEVSVEDLARMTARIIGNGFAIELIDYPDSYPPDEPRRRCPDLTKARKELAYSPIIGLRHGLERTLRWYRETFPEFSETKRQVF